MKPQLAIDNQIVVGGLTPLTTIDYPGELAAVIFMQGCPWSCGYCQNSELLPREIESSIPWTEVLSLLEKRKGLLDAVVFSGGEPTLQSGLESAMQQVKSMGFKIGLHTAGIYPDRLKKILPLIDWIGLDIKSAKADYDKITGVKGSGERAWKSARVVIDSEVSYEFRTTVHPDMLNKQQLSVLVDELIELGTENYVIQECVTEHCLDEVKRVVTNPGPESEFIKRFNAHFTNFRYRNFSSDTMDDKLVPLGYSL